MVAYKKKGPVTLEDDFLDILLSPEEAQATWGRLMGEGEAHRATAAAPQAAQTPAAAPASVPTSAPRPTEGAIWPPYAGRTATPGRTATRRCVPKVGTSIQRSGDRGARKLIELAFPPPPPPQRPRARSYLRPTATAQPPTQPLLRPTATTAAAVTDTPPPTPRLRVVADQPFRGRVVLAVPTVTIDDDDDPPPRAAAVTSPGRRQEQQPTRTLTVAPGVHLDIPLTAIYQRRYFRAKAGNGRWTLRFDDQGRLRSAFKK